MAQTVKSNPQMPSTNQSTNLPTQNKFTILAPPTPSKPSEQITNTKKSLNLYPL
ncbi:hypothetical protein SESBI_29941 [Sesbania bispinosa]|nr:hypothetical protein SESBI_29941 [Sesbania bispinosa]